MSDKVTTTPESEIQKHFRDLGLDTDEARSRALFGNLKFDFEYLKPIDRGVMIRLSATSLMEIDGPENAKLEVDHR